MEQFRDCRFLETILNGGRAIMISVSAAENLRKLRKNLQRKRKGNRILYGRETSVFRLCAAGSDWIRVIRCMRTQGMTVWRIYFL